MTNDSSKVSHYGTHMTVANLVCHSTVMSSSTAAVISPAMEVVFGKRGSQCQCYAMISL